MDIRIGTSGWTYNDWKGPFYPENWAKSKWLDYYVTRFTTVEINATFYGTFKPSTYENWRDRAPEGFLYVLKAPRYITHRKLLVDVQADIETFWNSATILGQKLGLILLQVAPNTPYDLDRLRQAVLAFGNPSQVAVEFRNERWLNPEVEQLLRQLGAVYCTPDSPESHLNSIVTASNAYIRMHGRTRYYHHDYSQAELEEVVEVIRQMEAKGAERIYVFFNNDFHANAVRNALLLRELIEKDFQL